MKHNFLVGATLLSFGCQDTASQQNETELRALRVELERVRNELETAQTQIQKNALHVADSHSDISSLWDTVNGNTADIQQMLSDMVTSEWVTSALDNGSGSLGELATRVDTLENTYGDAATALSSTAALAEKVRVSPTGDVVFYNTNVHIQNGTGSTSDLNGKGNLFIGYNGTDGTLDRTGSHNLVIGDMHSFTAHTGVVAGNENQILADYAVALGTTRSQATGDYAVAIGGEFSHVSAHFGTVLGGGFNTVGGAHGVSIGGYANLATGTFSSAVGGQSNIVHGDYASAAGGTFNMVDELSSTVAGGHSLDVEYALTTDMVTEIGLLVSDVAALEETNALQNLTLTDIQTAASDLTTRVSSHNDLIAENSGQITSVVDAISDMESTVSALLERTEDHQIHIDDLESRMVHADELLSVVDVDERGDVVFSNTNLVLNNGTGDTNTPNMKGNLIVGYNAYDGEERTGSHNIVVGDHNQFTGTAGLVVGNNHRINGHGSAIIGGDLNLLDGDNSVIIGGYTTDVAANLGTAIGGAHNTITATYATAIGGYGNSASGEFATAGPGRENAASGDYASAMGGALNTAAGEATSISGGYATETTDPFGMGTVTALFDALSAESERLSSVENAIEDVQENADEIMAWTNDTDLRLSAFDATTAVLESNDTDQAVAITLATAERSENRDLILSARSELEAADDTFSIQVAELSTSNDALTSAVFDTSVGLAALGDRLVIVEDTGTAHAAQIAAIQESVATAELMIDDTKANVDDLSLQTAEAETRIGALESHAIEANNLLAYVTVEDGDVIFRGTNLRLENGGGETHSANGKGNLVIGYNASELGTEERTGSHNIVLGDNHVYSSSGSIIVGQGHVVSAANAAAIGGNANTVSGLGAVAVAGANNHITQTAAAGVAGHFNTVSGSWSSAIAGSYHVVSGPNAAILGGHTGTISAEHSVIVGGFLGNVSANLATVLGGSAREATESFAVVPIDDIHASVASLESFTEDLGEDVSDEIDSNTARISDLESASSSIQSRVDNNESSIATNATGVNRLDIDVNDIEDDIGTLTTEDESLWEAIEDLDNSRDVADGLFEYLTVSTTGDIVFEGANLIVRNGSGSTDGSPDGKGNLIIGYNEMDDDASRIGSHNLVLGSANSYSGFGGIVAGYDNVQSGEFASVLGGTANEVSGTQAVVVAGQANVASGENAVVVSGYTNEASGVSSATISGVTNEASAPFSAAVAGSSNEAAGVYSATLAGESNTASGQSAATIAGLVNHASGRNSAVFSGKENEANGSTSAVVAGWLNRANGVYSGILSGYDSDADGEYSAITAGFKNDTTHSGSVVLGGAYVSSTGLYSVDP